VRVGVEVRVRVRVRVRVVRLMYLHSWRGRHFGSVKALEGGEREIVRGSGSISTASARRQHALG